MAKGRSLAVKSVDIQGNIMFGDMDIYERMECSLKLRDWLNSNADLYGCMVHDMDIGDDGKPKIPHIHFVAHLFSNGKGSPRLGTTLNKIADFCGVPPLAVSIFKPSSMEEALQYFTHQKHPEKAQYPKENFITNIEVSILDSMLSADVSKLDEETLILTVAKADTKSDVMRSIGLYYYRMYRGLISDLWEEFHGVRSSRAFTNSVIKDIRRDN